MYIKSISFNIRGFKPSYVLVNMTKIKIKPLSVNQAFKGRRFKTEAYKKYERDLLLLLPKIEIPEPPYQVYYKFGFSSRNSDIDNGVKQLQDILSKKYKFNDRYIFIMVVEKEIVKKGDEFVEFKIERYEK